MDKPETRGHSRSHRGLALIPACMIWLVACTGPETPPTTGSAGSAASLPAADPEPAAADVGSRDALVEFARQDLAGRLSVPIDSIRLVEAGSVTWPSSAIGCPRPGMGYAQVLVPGSLIVLQVGKDRFAYHAGSGREPFYCPADRAERPIAEAVSPGT